MANILMAASTEPRKIMKRILAAHDFACEETIGGAINFARTTFDLIICTIVFDEFRMFEFLRLVKAQRGWRDMRWRVAAAP